MAEAFLSDRPALPAEPLRRAIGEALHAGERQCVEHLLQQAALSGEQRGRIRARARGFAERIRLAGREQLGVEVFLQEYGLSTQEGVMLMCLAEALLRVPDAGTADRLIQDKLGRGDWARHLGNSDSLLVNASTWGLMLTGRFVRLDPGQPVDWGAWAGRLVQRLGEPLLRQALLQSMRVLGRHFVLGQSIEQAIERAAPTEASGNRYSYDMLGEAARTMADAQRYRAAYRHAIEAIGRASSAEELMARPGISIKLSALHPRYELSQHGRVRTELLPAALELLCLARQHRITVTIDAEEADRLEPSLDLFEALTVAPELAGWPGVGIAVQAYQKRAVAVIAWLEALASRQGRRIPVRLVKGAYWDSEIKHAQELGLAGYPVFTRKLATDVSYLVCARRLLEGGEAFYPQFATHNAQTLAAILELAEGCDGFELQRLHGMGEALYAAPLEAGARNPPCRVYAPVGSHQDLLPYLVRRLLENGANSSFVNQIMDPKLPLERLIDDPAEQLRQVPPGPHPLIPEPPRLFGAERQNARGFDLADPATLAQLAAAVGKSWQGQFDGLPLEGAAGMPQPVVNPADRTDRVGLVTEPDSAALERGLARAAAAFPDWAATPIETRAGILQKAADLFEQAHGELLALCIREAGKTLPDAVAELREAIDFLRYYATEARRVCPASQLPGPTGEDNRLSLHGRGVFLAISPWNFPLAIFTGQLAAALVVGNTVVAKSAPQTPLIAAAAVRLLRRAGLPEDVLVLATGGAELGRRLVVDPRIAGVVFTGSTATARAIQQALAARAGPILPLIAETGGQNAMLVDSSALPEQVVADALTSAFRSAGQRCSALRVLCLQTDIAARVLTMLQGAMAELVVGDPARLGTDIGPVIDAAAQTRLEAHAERMRRLAPPLAELALGAAHAAGWFVPPRVFEVEQIDQIGGEVFGPILHVVRFAGDRLDAMIDAVNATGYGLTLGVHSRIDATIERVKARARAGNIYVNRNMIGAVVGVQPFGGEGLSGTGPKAGGPHYLPRFATERTISVNTAAVGGNTDLLRLESGL